MERKYYKILESVFIYYKDVESELVHYFCETLGCPWTVNDRPLFPILKIHKCLLSNTIVDDNVYIIEFNSATWGNITKMSGGILEVNDKNLDLIIKYF